MIYIINGKGKIGGLINVICPEESQITVNKNDESYTKIGTNVDFSGLSEGIWNITAIAGDKQYTTTEEIILNYEETVNYFEATINVTFPVDCTSVTCSKGDIVLSVPSGSLSSGSYTFTIPESGSWVLYATNGEKEKSITLTITEEKAYTFTLSFELMAFLNGTTDPALGGWSGTSVTGSLISFRPENGSSGSVSSNNRLDLRSFTKITFHISGLASQDYSLSKVGIGDNKTGGSFVASATLPTGAGAWGTSDVTKVIDITNVDSGYIKIYASSSNNTAMVRIEIDKILLE